MKKTVTYLTLALILPISANAATKNGTGQYLTHEGLKYEILESDNPELGVVGQEEELLQVTVPSTIQITFEDNSIITYTVTQINSEAFKGNTTLSYFEFANTITEIGDGAFEDCEAIEFNELPESLLSIGDNAFKGCKSQKRVKLPETVMTLGSGCFSEMTSLRRAILYSDVTELPSDLFREDIDLEEVYLPKSLVKIGDRAFYNTLSLEEVLLPDTLEEIGEEAFYGGGPSEGRQGLHYATLPASMKKLGDRAFFNSGLHTINLGNIEELGRNAFDSSMCMKDIIFSPSLKIIGDEAFSWCATGQPLNEVVLPATVEKLGENAFLMTLMTKLDIGDLITELPTGSCGKPQILKLGSGITKLHENAINFFQLKCISIMAPEPPEVEGEFKTGWWVWDDAVPLTTEEKNNILLIVADDDAKAKYMMADAWKDFNIVVADDEMVHVSLEEGTSLEEALNTLGKDAKSISHLTLEGNINYDDFYFMRDNMLLLSYLDMKECANKTIPFAAFQNRISLETVILPSGLTRIESNAFEWCISMDIAELPDGIEYIDPNAFAACNLLTVSKMPSALKEVGSSAFYDCFSLQSIIFDENLESIGGGIFHTCINLKSVDLSKTKIKVLPGQAFIHNPQLTTLLLPESIEVIESGSVSVTDISSLNMPAALKRIDDDGITETKIRTLNFGSNLVELGDRALAKNPKLLTVSLPGTVEKIGKNVFEEDYKVSVINSYAVNAPQASAETFTDIDTHNCILSVPVNSLSSYLEAPGWDLFSNIENTLEIDVPDDTDVTVIPEKDYQDLLEEEEARRNLGPVSDVEESTKGYKTFASATPYVTSDINNSELLDGSLFCKLQNGSVIASEKNEKSLGHRIFIFTKDGKPVSSVKVNDVEMIDRMEGNSLVIPANSIGTLSVNGGGSMDNVNSITNVTDQPNNVYDISGRCVLINATNDQIKNLDKGLYIIKGKKILVK